MEGCNLENTEPVENGGALAHIIQSGNTVPKDVTRRKRKRKKKKRKPAAIMINELIRSDKDVNKNQVKECLMKLEEQVQELETVYMKTRQCFTNFRASLIFTKEQTKVIELRKALKEVHDGIHSMGQILGVTLVGERVLETVKSNLGKAHIPDISNLTTTENEVDTPPASEAGSDDLHSHTSKLGECNEQEDTLLPEKKRLRSMSSAPEVIEKKRKRSLMDDFVIRIPPSDVSLPERESKDGSEKAQDVCENYLSDNSEEFEVEKIKDFAMRMGTEKYKVSWRGYGSEDDTWEPVENLTGCDDLLAAFYENRLAERAKVSSRKELVSLRLPPDPRPVIERRKGFKKKYYKPKEDDLNRALQLHLAGKAPKRKTEAEIEADIDKALEMKSDNARFSKLVASIAEHLLYAEMRKKREVQVAKLDEWGRNINFICTDPAPLQVENNVDLSLPPQDFKYINEYLAGKGISIPTDPIIGCECGEDCINNKKTCCANQMCSWFAYNRYNRLSVSIGTPIYECNARCKCSRNCYNRVVQNGRNIRLAIFRTDNGRGWGVKSLENIKKDTFVTEYVGEVISSDEAERRGEKYDAQGCTYLFDLDYNSGDNLYTVDAAYCGNVSHFINHSCDPNLVVFNVWVNCLDPDLPRLALFAAKDIKKGEEITFDYNSGMTRRNHNAMLNEDGNFTPNNGTPNKVDEKPTFLSPKQQRGSMYGKSECKCGAPNCRQYFF